MKQEEYQPLLKKEEVVNRKSPGMFGFIRGAMRVPVGILLGVATITVAAVRSVFGVVANATLSAGGAVATIVAGGAHVLNFIGFQARKGIYKMIGKDTSKLNVNSTKNLLKKAANFTENRIEGVLSSPYDIFSGKQDEKIKITTGLKKVPNTYFSLIKSIQLIMAMSPEERNKADIARSGQLKKSSSRDRF